MKLLAALALLGTVAVVAAFSVSTSNTDKQFTYQFTSQVLTGIPKLNSQYAGLRITALALIQIFPDLSIRIKLQDTKYKTYNDVLNLSEERDILSTEEVEVPSDIKTYLEAPFKVKADKNGVFDEIYTEAGEPEFVTNLKKSFLVGSFSLFLGQDLQSMLDTNTIQRNPQQMKTAFKTMEKSVIGECEVEYTVNKLPEYLAVEFEQKEQNTEAAKACQGKDYYEVIKATNLEKCKERPIYQHTYGARSKSDGSMGATSPYLAESSIMRTICCGTFEDPLYRKSTVENKFLTSPNGKFESTENIEVISRMTAVLKSIDPKATDIKDVTNPKLSHHLVYEFPSEDYWTSVTSGKPKDVQSQWHDANMIPQLPMLEMTSAHKSLYPNSLDAEKSKQLFVDTFVKFVDVSKQSPESSHAVQDVSGQVLDLTRLALTFSYADIKALWTMINANLHHDLAHKQSAQHVFMDLLSIAATNPCVKYVSESIKKQFITGETAAWIVANMIKSVKTPSEEVIQELTNLLKHSSVQTVKSLKATVAMSLTELVYKACIDETSSVFDYPARIFGKFCNKDSKVIQKDLLPYLVGELQAQKDQLQQHQPSTSAINSAIIYINALGNLGIDEASHALIEVVEGKMTLHTHPRSVAVYKLIRSAKRNPSVYRPIILSIIQNVAENDEVRMAAISVLPYTYPSSSDLQKLAIRTWFESSQQVSSYITSTLKSLKNLPLQTKMYQNIAQQAEQAHKLAKPLKTGIQTSHNIKISQFLDTLRAAVSLHLQYVNSEESAVPRRFYVKSDIESKSQIMEKIESSIYIQGSEVLIEKLYNLYKMIHQHKIKHESNIDIKNRMAKQPEAHVTLNMMGLQRLYSIDSQFIQDIIMQLTEEYTKDYKIDGIQKDFLKVLDLAGYQNIIPTVAGIPLYVQQRTPMVIATHASLMMVKSGAVEIKVKPVFNYKQSTLVGIFCPFTKKFLGAGVDTSLHVAVPLRADVGLHQGQLSVTLKTPIDVESQKVKPVFELKVRPYTTQKILDDTIPIQNSKDSKTIHSNNEKKMMQVQLGEKIGVDLKLKMESEHKFTDIASFIQDLSHHQPLTLLSLPLPLKSIKSHTISLIYNPSTSITKEASFLFSVGYGQFSRQNTRTMLSKFEGGSAITINAVALVRGHHEDTIKKIETHVTIGQNLGHHNAGEKSEIGLMASLKIAPNGKPFDLDIHASSKLHTPTAKWDKEAILQQDLKTKITIKADFGFRGEEKVSVSGHVHAIQSQAQKIYSKHSSAAKECETDISYGQKLSKSCKQTRTQAASLDVVEATIHIPAYISQNPQIKSLAELVKAFYWPYLSISQAQHQHWQQEQGMDKYVVQAKIHQLGQRMSLYFLSQEQQTEIKDLRLGNYMQGLLPISTIGNPMMNIVQKLTAHGAPSVCSVEGGKVTTFDNVQYEYQLNNCEHVIFKDCSPTNTVEVSMKKSAHVQYVKVLLDGNKYELELMKPLRSARAAGIVKVNGEQKHIQHGHHGKKQQKSEFVELEENYYLDENTYLTSYKDGVFAIVSKLYGMWVYADSESVEVKTFQHRWRNQACGLCGDLNDEKTADLKSAGSCIMSTPKLAAYSYMITDNKCQGIPAQHLKQYQEESAKCVKKEMVPTKVTQLLQQKPVVSRKHLVEEFFNRICISKFQVNVCESSTAPKEIIKKQVPYFCTSKDTRGATLQRMAEQGEKIQNVERFPTSYLRDTYQPIKC
eukprot:GFUD01009884.1.p1 GENE.GFUD01009884.1~~GFUD01009884.1.p1  ORF type:complete len:1721 (+),score=446.76 GFUD01009884.1:69-5231(+)